MPRGQHESVRGLPEITVTLDHGARSSPPLLLILGESFLSFKKRGEMGGAKHVEKNSWLFWDKLSYY